MKDSTSGLVKKFRQTLNAVYRHKVSEYYAANKLPAPIAVYREARNELAAAYRKNR